MTKAMTKATTEVKAKAMTEIMDLDCSRSKLKTLKLPKTVQTVNCSYNKIANLKLTPNLEELDCSHNPNIQLSEIPPTLKILKMFECEIDDVFDLKHTSLEELSTTSAKTLIVPRTLKKLQLNGQTQGTVVFTKSLLTDPPHRLDARGQVLQIVGDADLIEFELVAENVKKLILPQTLQRLIIKQEQEEKKDETLEIEGATNLLALTTSHLSHKLQMFNQLRELYITHQYYRTTISLEDSIHLEGFAIRSDVLTHIELPGSIRYLDFSVCHKIKEIIIDGEKINVSDREKFFDFSTTSLTTLICSGCEIDKLFLPKTLLELNCSRNDLRSISINDALEYCDILGNIIHDNIKSCYLQHLSCYSKYINPIFGYNLKTLCLEEYDEDTLDLKHTEISELSLSHCSVKKIIFPKTLQNFDLGRSCVQLIDFTGTEVTGVDLSLSDVDIIIVSSNIVSLICEVSRVTEIDLTNAISLTYLDCSHNKIESLTLPESLVTLICDGNPLTELDLSEGLEKLECNSTNIKHLDISHTQVELLSFCNARVQKTLILNETVSQLTCDKIQKNIDLSKTKITRFIYKHIIDVIRLPENIRIFHLSYSSVVCIGKKVYNSIGLLLKSSLKNNIEKLENNKEKNPFIRKHNLPKTKHHIHYLLSLRLLEEMRNDIRNLPDIGKD